MKTTHNQAYDFMGKLAVALQSQNIQISFDSLKAILKEKGMPYSEDSNLGIGRSVSSAYKAWEKIDNSVHHAIAVSFTSRDGSHAWE
ncbi:VOC family protein [Nonlabens xiamenensis]|uniref:hypothetical protein n=1 Tax=Nonlabens xiamenensis TaxID=2341043 RepID=UPI000F610F41|nr:hypothetical protein [Nonlabens xiamenensis]